MSNYTKREVPDYIKKDFSTEFSPCPRCGSEYVSWTNSRDLDVLCQEVYCECCGLTTFNIETCAFMNLPNKDYETTLMKYNAWVNTNPTNYGEDSWDE